MTQRYLYFILLVLMMLVGGCDANPSQPTLVSTSAPIATETPTGQAQSVLPTQPPAPEVTARDPAQQAYLRIIHAAPQTGMVDIYIEQLSYGANLPYGSVTSQAGISAGEWMVRVMPDDQAEDSVPLLETQLSIRGGDKLVLLFTGNSEDLNLLVFNETLQPLDVGQSRVTMIHAAPNAPDVELGQEDNGLVPAVAFGERAESAILPVGDTTLDFQSGGDTFVNHSVTLREGVDYTFILIVDPENPNGYSILSFDSRVPGRTSVRVIHAALETGAVDVVLDNEQIAAGLDYARTSERITTAADVRVVHIYSAGEPENEIASAQVVLERDATISLIVLGTGENLRVLPYVENLSPTPDDEARVALVNTLESVPVARVETINGTLAIVAYAQQPVEVYMRPESITISWGIDDVETNFEVLEIGANLQFEPGRSYLYLFTGSDLETPPLIFSESVGTESEIPPDVPTVQVRFVNAIMDGTEVDFLLDDTAIVSDLSYGEISEPLEISSDEHTISVRVSSTDETFVTSEFIFDAEENYSFYVFGDDVVRARTRLLADSFTSQDTAASIRLVNLSFSSDVQMGIAYTDVEITPVTPLAASAETTVEPEPLRQTLPFNVLIMTNEIRNTDDSAGFAALTGSRNVYILDSLTGEVSAIVRALPLEAGFHYDFIAAQEADSQRVRVFVLIYPVNRD